MKLTHRHVEVFRAVMAAGSVTRAAEALHSSQPTVSRELARLEQVLQMPLFDRVKGRLRPTVRALAQHAEVERSWVGLERIAATALALRQSAAGRLAIGCLPALAHALLPDAARRFAALQPQAALSITTQESPLLDDWLTAQRFDIGLIERADAPAGTEATPLLQADEVCVLPDGHPLLEKRVLKPRDFADLPFIGFAPSDPYRLQVDALFEAAGVTRRMTIDTASAVSVCALVRQGLGLAIINPLTAMEMAGTGLQVRPFAPSVPFAVSLVLPAFRPGNPLRDGFVAALRAATADLQKRLRKLARPA